VRHDARTLLSRRVAPVLLALATGACVSPPEQRPPAGTAAPPAAMPTPASAYEQRLREQALAQARQGRLADAAVSWEILTVLRPDAGEYRERMNETRRLIEAAVPERLRRAQAAHKRGELDAATTQYLAVLALQPEHEQAAEALRAIERDRNRSRYLGKYSRITLERGNGLQATAKRPAAPLDVNEAGACGDAARAGRGRCGDRIARAARRPAGAGPQGVPDAGRDEPAEGPVAGAGQHPRQRAAEAAGKRCG
jgi:hypothetical protein